MLLLLPPVADRIGIDPGCSGALVALDGDRPVDWMLMPTLKVGTNTRVNAAAVADFLGRHPGAHVFLEQVGAMPGQGGASMFTFGHAAGVVQGVVQGMGHPLTLVTPQKWKKAAGLIGSEKDIARSTAILLWPTWRDLDAKGKGQALADAALIARFGGETSTNHPKKGNLQQCNSLFANPNSKSPCASTSPSRA